jgi:hypothetical protein
MLLGTAVVAAEGDPVKPEKASAKSEESEPPIPLADSTLLVTEPTPEELAEIEWIKKQLGNGYSLAARLDRLPGLDHSPQEHDLPRIVGPEESPGTPPTVCGSASAEAQMLRTMARQLERTAADLEEKESYDLADQIRGLAASHWRVARLAGLRHSGNSPEARR